MSTNIVVWTAGVAGFAALGLSAHRASNGDGLPGLLDSMGCWLQAVATGLRTGMEAFRLARAEYSNQVIACYVSTSREGEECAATR
jgi:hypothetical protein